MRKLVPGLLAVVAALAFSLWAWPHLPSRMATHFDLHGQANGWSSRAVAVALFPAMGLLMAGLFSVLPRIDPRGANYQKFGPTYWTVVNAILVLVAGIHVVMIGKALGWPIDITRVLSIGLGGLFVLLGNVMTRIRPNWFMGIRTPWTLSSDSVWRKTHRLGGVLFVASGLCVVIAGFVTARWVFPVAVSTLGVAAFVSVVYSYLAWRSEQQAPPASRP